MWSPLAGGFLTGKYAPGERTVSGSRSEEGWAYPQQYFADSADDTLGALLEISGRSGCPPAAAAVRWVLEQPAITSAIVGASNCAQLQSNLRAADVRLEPDDLETLNRTSALQPRYPKAMQDEMRARRDNAVGKPGA